jgi:hypothetical protein
MKKCTFYCDGCGRKLENETLRESEEYTMLFNSQAGVTKTDIFCQDQCRAFAADYWEESGPVARKALTDAASTINNHRTKFFATRRPSKLEKVG